LGVQPAGLNFAEGPALTHARSAALKLDIMVALRTSASDSKFLWWWRHRRHGEPATSAASRWELRDQGVLVAVSVAARSCRRA
jgi:hypothetical protein